VKAVILILCMLAVPTAQLRTVARITTCCCPDENHCHCPKPPSGSPDQPSARTCHKQSHDFVAPLAPAFVTPELVAVSAPVRAMTLASAPLRTPHAAPAPRRPDAPS
jgi:hypothetical protein